MKTALKVTNISKKYNNKTVLDDINFTVNEGEIVALIGKNGTGKSTLINIITGLIKPDSGSSMILEKQIFDRNLVGVMLQDSLTLNRIKVKEVIKLVQSYYQHPLTYPEILNLSQLEDHQNKLMTQLSGGQKRRLQFALAMAGDPKLIFLDEPTTGMDPDSRTNFWQLINSLKKQGKTFFITSHYLEELEKTANRFIFLNHHQLAFDGSLKDMRTRINQTEISFSSELIIDIFKKLPAITDIKEINHNYTIVTDNLNAYLPSLIPYLDAISNLEIHQNTLDSLMNAIIKKRA